MLCRTALLALTLTFAANADDLWKGIAGGPHRAGFRFERTVDPTRRTPLGLAVWYPAESPTGSPMTQLDYRVLAFARGPDASEKQAFLDDEAAMMVAWRHVGIVPLTLDQARAAVNATGRAFRGAPPVAGRFPVVVLLGGAWYLSTTAEILASHGFLVVAPVRFSDVANDLPTLEYSWSMESSARDAEWALAELARDPAADIAHVAAIGHGGGGLQALILAMRNRGIHSVANVDAANFSTRSNPRQLAFYHPRLLRVPYLNILTASTRQQLDLYSDFENMRFSRRYELILGDPALRHHDLSDVGHGVSAVLGIRGEAQENVLRTYAQVQDQLLRFLKSPMTASGEGLTVREGIEPAPDTAAVIESLGEATPGILAQARARDPEAPLFGEDELQKITGAARTRPALAAAIARFALEVHPKSLPIHRLAADALTTTGDRGGAAEIVRRCVALDLPQNDWRAAAAQAACRARAN